MLQRIICCVFSHAFALFSAFRVQHESWLRAPAGADKRTIQQYCLFCCISIRFFPRYKDSCRLDFFIAQLRCFPKFAVAVIFKKTCCCYYLLLLLFFMVLLVLLRYQVGTGLQRRSLMIFACASFLLLKKSTVSENQLQPGMLPWLKVENKYCVRKFYFSD